MHEKEAQAAALVQRLAAAEREKRKARGSDEHLR